MMDAALFALSFWLAFKMRQDAALSHLLGIRVLPTMRFSEYFPLYLLLILAAPFVLESCGFYNRTLLSLRRRVWWPLLRGCAFLSLGIVVGLFALRLDMPRSVVGWFGGISFGLMVIKEELMRLPLRSRHARDEYRRRFILVGMQDELARTRWELGQAAGEEVEVIEQLDLGETPLVQLVKLLHERSVNGVIVSARRAYFDQVEAVIHACELEGVEVWLMPDFFQPQISHTSLDDLNGRPVLVFKSTPEASWEGVAKRALDYTLAGLLLAILGLPMALLALIIRLTSRGPALFRQQRAGLNGRPFTMYKFRTMVSNAEQLKAEMAALNEMEGPVFKARNDPRITWLGQFLRRWSFDELPQLVNVLRGEMSLVGPRPLPVDEVMRFDDLAHRRRLSVRPGLTCLWQVSGRNDIKDFREWVRLDLEYIDHWSIWLDLRILCWTVPAVFRGAGAR